MDRRKRDIVRWDSLLRRGHRTDTRAGIAASGEAVALAVVRRPVHGKPQVLHCAVARASRGYEDDALHRLLREANLGRAPVSAVVGADDYQLAQIAAPEVPEAEIRAAARWRMGEIIDFPLDDASVDVFDVPERRDRASRRMLFAVATRNDVPRSIASALQRETDRVDVIDIPELCQRNLSALLPQDEQGVAFVMLREDHAQLVLTRRGQLFVARRFDYDTTLHFKAGTDSSASGVDPNALALELQRSLDYYETHFDQPAITDLVVAPAEALTPQLAAEVASMTGLRVHPLRLGDCMESVEPAGIPGGWLPALAIGAALRTESTDG